MTRSESTQPVWLITGAGRGLGRAFAEAALTAGALVVGTVRTPGALADLAAAHPGRVQELQLDVRDRAAAHRAVDEAAAAFGGLDVVVNNAGAGLIGAIEEISEAQARDHLDLNLLGALWVTQAAIPHLRARGGGDVVQISTVGAIGSMPTFGLYNASKWGLEGFSEALAGEVGAFDISVTIAELGGFASDWAGASMPFASPLPAYDDLRTALFGTPEVPWPAAEPGGSEDSAEAEASADPDDSGRAAAPADAPPADAAQALLAHLARPRDARPLRVLIGDDAPGHASLAFEARRDSYGGDPRLTWPS